MNILSERVDHNVHRTGIVVGRVDMLELDSERTKASEGRQCYLHTLLFQAGTCAFFWGAVVLNLLADFGRNGV